MTEQQKLFDDEEQRKLDAEEKRVTERRRLAEIQAEARNKVQPKPPQVDDEGNDIPF
jgi:hypothetical protein